ncbi:MAG: radical SAM protein [Dehalococcoidia bacterium]
MPQAIHFYAPGLKRYQTAEFRQRTPAAFTAVSVTGEQCALNCDHCQGQLLHHMRPLRHGESLFALCEVLARQGAQGVLVSGGAGPGGDVPLTPLAGELARIKAELGLRVLVHTGLVDEAQARALAQAGVDGALLDIIGSSETISQVYHLGAGVEDYRRSLALLAEHGVPSMPHIVLGLHYGRWLGEEAALEMVSAFPVAALVLVVLTPLDGTPMDEVAPPSVAEIGAFFRRARAALPTTPVLLGCTRPMGEVKVAIDRAAVDAGLDGIAYPARGIVRYARRRGLQPVFSEACCAMLPVDGQGGRG